MNFTPFPKIARLSREVIVTEKIDGTNAQVFVVDNTVPRAGRAGTHMMAPRIGPLKDPAPIAPRSDVAKIDVSDLPDYATTAEEYWQITDRIWPAILDIFDRVGMSNFGSKADRLRLARDRKVVDLFNEAWAAAPDAFFIHSWPQWGRFCDLCSECYVLFEGDENGR
jgi:hypothetical protein